VLEERLKDVVKAERQRRWLEENRKGIEAMNAFVDRNGVFNEEDREW
jgi:antitoxin CcdA